MKILLIMTGGTICSFENERGERAADTERAEAYIVNNFKNGDSVYRDDVQFDVKSPLNILSENMTVTSWNTLVTNMKKYKYDEYDGVIILHGTDTLAYTSALLSLLMSGADVPVFLVSSQLPIYMEEANGNENFKTAVELIAKGVAPNVYAVYRIIGSKLKNVANSIACKGKTDDGNGGTDNYCRHKFVNPVNANKFNNDSDNNINKTCKNCTKDKTNIAKSS